MSAFNTTEAAPLMREVIMPGVRQYVNNATPVLKHIEKETQHSPTGEFIVVFNKTRDNNAGSGRPEEGVDLVTPGLQTAGRATVGAKQVYTRVKWTGRVVAATKSKDALVNAIVYQTEGAAKDHKHSKNRQLNGDGRDALGFYVSGASGTAVVVTDQWGNVGGDFFQSGTTKVDLINGSDHTVRQAGVTVTRGAVGSTGRALTAGVNLAAGATAGDYFVLADTIGQQLMGLRGVISNGNPPLLSGGLQGVTVASVPEFAASIVGDSAAPKDLQFHNLQRVLSEINRNSDEGSEGIGAILTSYPGIDTYGKACRDENITVNAMMLDGGFKGVAFIGTAMVPDKHVALGIYQFVNWKSMKLFSLADLDWDTAGPNGDMFYRISGGDRDALGATLKEYCELGVITRNANGALVGVNMLYV